MPKLAVRHLFLGYNQDCRRSSQCTNIHEPDRLFPVNKTVSLFATANVKQECDAEF